MNQLSSSNWNMCGRFGVFRWHVGCKTVDAEDEFWPKRALWKEAETMWAFCY